jgi:hypothetical protein
MSGVSHLDKSDDRLKLQVNMLTHQLTRLTNLVAKLPEHERGYWEAIVSNRANIALYSRTTPSEVVAYGQFILYAWLSHLCNRHDSSLTSIFHLMRNVYRPNGLQTL